MMDAKEIISFIGNAEKKTPVKVYVKERKVLISVTTVVRYSVPEIRSYSATGKQ